MLAGIRGRLGLSQEKLAHVLGVSFVSVNRWERGASVPSPALARKIDELYLASADPWQAKSAIARLESPSFLSRGIRRHSTNLTMPTLFDMTPSTPDRNILSDDMQASILGRLMAEGYMGGHHAIVANLLRQHRAPSPTVVDPPDTGMSAGKNTYTYDAHTYHTKVPPQGIAELLKHYLPEGGLVFDAFAGSGMTGVAARMLGYDVILNELSPAASFIANRFTSGLEPERFGKVIEAILDAVAEVREQMYTTTCRECGRATEILYTVWSYRVICTACTHEFILWDVCRAYGKRVRDHKILTEFACPSCGSALKKSRLSRTSVEPVQLGYMCCGSRQQEVTHTLNAEDYELLERLEHNAPLAAGYYPTTTLPDGVNLRQPKKHGIQRVDQFYTPRGLAAMSHLWRAIHRIEDIELAAFAAFVFTSLYQRVTRLSEFRFWGGSGNTARFNVPYIFNETNVFTTFARKARTIRDHLETTAARYGGQAVVRVGSATQLDYLPDESIDVIFTDPPFGANINYSEMNFLWESWLQQFTDATDEAIVNSVQGKDLLDYQRLMTASLSECFRVLRSGHWMLLVFMNSSSSVWEALRTAIQVAGFEIRQCDIFDKQHGTFKQYVSANTAGCDLVLHCYKPNLPDIDTAVSGQTQLTVSRNNGAFGAPSMKRVLDSVATFLQNKDMRAWRSVFLHVTRSSEVDFRKLYSEWTASSLLEGENLLDFAAFRSLVMERVMNAQASQDSEEGNSGSSA